MIPSEELRIRRLGPAGIDSPLFPTCRNCDESSCEPCEHRTNFVDDSAGVLIENRLDLLMKQGYSCEHLPTFELAGPRRKVYFAPEKTTAAIVTCGGLCPGLNDVIHGLTMELHYRYGLRRILGIRYGYEGFIESYGHQPLELTPQTVEGIHETGGTLLGTSRGPQDPADIVESLRKMDVRILFTIGGDGTQRGGMAIARQAESQGYELSVVGIPKTIDNDILWLDKSFGFETAFSEAVEAVIGAHSEAISAFNGVGLVKLMGRDSGFITCHTALATSHANAVLIPEVPFQLQGPQGLLAYLRARLHRRRHAVLIVAEGAGQDLLEESDGVDPSGNRRLGDIGWFLKKAMEEYFAGENMPHTVKYIDPSYIIRSVPATPKDSLYCLRLAQGAAHAAMAGRTEMVIGRWQEQYVHLPMPLVTVGRKRVDPQGDLWMSVLETTGQPGEFNDP